MDMAVARKHRADETAVEESTKRARPRRVGEADAFANSRNPVAEHLIRLEGAFAPEDDAGLQPYSGKVRLAILIGAPAALWALVALGALGLRALL
jgi:hypothetical protein